MYMAITYVILLDMFNHLAEKDKKYFRESREALFKGQKLEDVSDLEIFWQSILVFALKLLCHTPCLQ